MGVPGAVEGLEQIKLADVLPGLFYGHDLLFLFFVAATFAMITEVRYFSTMRH